MSKSKSPKKEQSSILPQIEHLLTEQTSAILEALDAKLSAQDRRIDEGFAAQDKRLEEKFVAQDIRLLAAVDKHFQKMEERFSKSLDELTKTFKCFVHRRHTRTRCRHVPALSVALQPLQIRPHVGCVLVTQIAVFLQIGIQPHH